MPDYYRQAVDAAIRDAGKPLADLTPQEQEQAAERAVDYLIEWDVFRMDSAGNVRGGRLIREANRERV